MNHESSKNELLPEFQNKICKKIAQLTRVIVQLNVINDESDACNKKLINNSEKEMSQHAKSCKVFFDEEKSKFLKDFKTGQILSLEIEKAKIFCEAEKSLLHSKLSTIEKEAKKSANFEMLDRKFGEKESKLKEALGTLKFIEDNFTISKKKFENDLKQKNEEITRLLKEINNSKTQTKTEKSNYESAIKKLQTELAISEQNFQEEKIQSMKNEFLNSKKIENFEKQINDFMIKLANYEKLTNNERDGNELLKEQINNFSNKIKSMDEEVLNLNSTIISLRENKAQLENIVNKNGSDLNKLTKEKENLVEENQKMINDLKIKTDTESNLSLKIIEVNQHLNEKVNQLQILQDKFNQQNQKMGNLDQALKSSNGTYSEISVKLNLEISKYKDVINTLEFKINELQNELQKLKSLKSEFESENKNIKKENKNANDEIEKLNSLLKKWQSNFENKNIELKNKTDDYEIKKKDMEICKLKLEESNSLINHLSQKITDLEQKIIEINSGLSDKSISEQKLTSQISELVSKINLLNSQIISLQNNTNDETKQLTDALVQCRIEIQKKENFIERLKKYHTKVKKTIISSLEKGISLNRSIENKEIKKSLISNNNTKIASNLNALFDTFEIKSFSKMKNLSIKLSKLFDFCAKFKESISTLKKTNFQISEEEISKSILQNKIEQLTSESRLLLSKINDLNQFLAIKDIKIAELNQKLKSLVSDSHNSSLKVENELNSAKRDLNNLQKEHATRIKEILLENTNSIIGLSKMHETEIKKLVEKFTKTNENLSMEINCLKESHLAQISALKIQSENDLNDSIKAYQLKLESLKMENENQLLTLAKNLRGDFEKKIKVLNFEKESLILSFTNQITSAKSELQAVFELKSVLELKNNELSQIILKLQITCENLDKNLEEEIQKNKLSLESLSEKTKTEKNEFENDIKLKYLTFKTGLENTMTALVNDQEILIQEIKSDFQQELNTKEILVDDLQRLFKQRPSKTEDLERICLLSEDLKLKQHELVQVQQQLRFFRLELVNRDKNYNEIFNSNPHVGVLDPISQQNIGSMALVGGKENGGYVNVSTKGTVSGGSLGKVPANQKGGDKKISSKQFSIKTILK